MAEGARVGDTLAGERPRERSAMALQDWRELAFLHWPVPVESVRPRLPAGVEPDLYAGEAWVSLVPFAARRSRPVAVPAVLGLDFLECNVRTYVRVAGVPGVYFHSMDCDSTLAVAGARVLFGLPYFRARMALSRIGELRTYRVARLAGPQCRVCLRPEDDVRTPVVGSLDHFLTERRCLYVRHLGALWRIRIRHRAWPLRDSELIELHDELVPAAGYTPKGPPLVHLGGGVDVEFLLPERISRLRTG